MMLTPVRVDTLDFHLNYLRWMGYPLVMLLFVSLSCVLYAVSRSPAETPPAVVARLDDVAPMNEIDGGIALLSAQQSRELEEQIRRDRRMEAQRKQQAKRVDGTDEDEGPAIAEGKIVGVVNASIRDELESVGRSLVEASPPIAKPHRWLGGWTRRLADWQQTATPEATDARRRPDVAPPTDAATDAPATATESPSTPTPTRQAETVLTLQNPASNRGPVAFLVDGEQVVLRPGEARVFSGSQRRTVRFHRGGPHGNASFVLDHGHHRFTVTSKGWDLIGSDR